MNSRYYGTDRAKDLELSVWHGFERGRSQDTRASSSGMVVEISKHLSGMSYEEDDYIWEGWLIETDQGSFSPSYQIFVTSR
jgi:hypothetical protein